MFIEQQEKHFLRVFLMRLKVLNTVHTNLKPFISEDVAERIVSS